MIDLRTLRPLDDETILSFRPPHTPRRGVDEGWRTGSLSAEIAARVQDACFWQLDAPVARVCSAEVPVPYPKHLEQAALPQVADIVAAVKASSGVDVMSVFTMPSLGADMEEGKLVEWLVAPGDKVARGDIVAVVETQKGAVEIEIFEAGEIAELLAQPGQTLPVGAPLARLGGPDEAKAGIPLGTAAPNRGNAKSLRKAPGHGLALHRSRSRLRRWKRRQGTVLASPAARARATELGIDIETRRWDRVLAVRFCSRTSSAHAAAASDTLRQPTKAERPQGKPGLDMTEMRRAIAAAMARAKREIPHYYLSHEIDLQAAQDRLTALNADAHARPAAAHGGTSDPCHRAGAREGAGTERPVRGRTLFSRGSHPLRAGHRDARWWADCTGNSRRGQKGPRRDHGCDARHCRPHPRRPPAQQRDHAGHDHGVKLGRDWCRRTLRRDLPAAGGTGGFRHTAREAHGSRRSH